MARNVTAYALLVFFVSLNLSLYLLNETEVLPDYRQSAYEEPAGMIDIFGTLTLESLLMVAGTSLTVGGLLALFTGNLALAGTVGLILMALQMVFRIVRWILFGFPIFLGQLGIPSVIVLTIEVLMAVVWGWFIIGFVGQRSGWEQ